MLKKPRDFIKTKEARYFWLLLFGAFLIRVIGIGHGYPFVFHPDEPSVIRSALGLMFEPNPKHFDWPHFHFYLNYHLFWNFTKFRRIFTTSTGVFSILWKEPIIFYLVSRAFNSLLGALTLIPVYLTGRSLFNKNVGLIAAALLTILPFHVHASRLALIDVPMTFWLSIGVFFSAKILTNPNYRYYIFSGFFIGLAASTKYNGGLVALAVPTAHILRTMYSKDEKVASVRGALSLVFSGIFAAFGFILGTPYALLDFKTFSRTDSPKGALWQFTNVGSVSGADQFHQFLNVITFKLSDDFGFTILVAYFMCALVFILAAVFYKSGRFTNLNILKEKSIEVWFLLIPSLFMFYYISGFAKPRSHYFMMVYPFVVLLAGAFLLEFLKIFSKYKSVLLIAFFVLPLYMTSLITVRALRADTRVLLYKWLENNLTNEDLIYYSNKETKTVLEPFSNKSNSIKEVNTPTQHDVMIFTFSDHEYSNFLHGNSDYDFVNKTASLKEEIKPYYRNGPNILIYRGTIK
ncbi:MAG: phospholipid carrier-dependent glycosyltransferase [Patescibacteria group bacterium]